jgi:hypothetical protein
MVKDSEGINRGVIEILSGYLPGGTKENDKSFSQDS